MHETSTLRGIVGPIVACVLCSCAGRDALAPQDPQLQASGQIAFNAIDPVSGAPRLAFVRPDGSNLRWLYLDALSPAFSDDGKLIAAVADMGQSLVVMNADGSNRRSVIRWRFLGKPSWSPDGSQLAFACPDSLLGYSSNICVVNANGGVMRRITHRELSGSSPTWSPDGRLVAFACAPGGYSYRGDDPNPPEPFTPAAAHGICVANSDGSGWRQLTSAANGEPSWSWTTNQIVATRDYTLITIISPAGDTVRTLPTPAFSDVSQVTWSPDGQTVAFVGVKEQLRGDAWVHLDFDSIYLIKSDATGLTRLTNGFDAGSPAWAR